MTRSNFFRINLLVFSFAILVSSCKKQLPESDGKLPYTEEEVTMSSTTQLTTYPDVSKEFDNILKETKSRCEQLQKKWPINSKTFENDLNYLISRKKNPFENYFTTYYTDFISFQNLMSRFLYIKDHFKNRGAGDIKTGVFKKYNEKNGGRVFYKGKVYTVEQLGNINFGVGCKAIGFPYFVSACSAGLYQAFAEVNLNLSKENAKKLMEAIKTAVRNSLVRSSCFDNPGDSKMIKTGYNWF